MTSFDTSSRQQSGCDGFVYKTVSDWVEVRFENRFESGLGLLVVLGLELVGFWSGFSTVSIDIGQI